MENTFLTSEFFLSANTTEGFFSAFNNLYYPQKNWFCYILKGGPGTGKSTLMKKISEKAFKKSIRSELIHCSSDPDSLDAVIFPELKIAIADGTAPHVLDPIYPGVSDSIINLGEYWNSKNLFKFRDKIINLCEKNTYFHQKAKSYLKAYGSAFNEINNIIRECINYRTLDFYCERLTKKIFKKSKNKINKGNEQIRFISSITPSGHLFFNTTLSQISDKIFIIEDAYSLVGNYILKNIKDQALEKGKDVILCPSPFAPSHLIEAVFIPELGLGFAVKNPKELSDLRSKFDYKKITTKRFLNSEMLSNHKNFISFNRKLLKEFLKEATSNLHRALKVHDEIENIYIQNMNYSKINKIADKLISAIL